MFKYIFIRFRKINIKGIEALREKIYGNGMQI